MARVRGVMAARMASRSSWYWESVATRIGVQPAMTSDERRMVERNMWSVLTSNFGNNNFNFREKEDSEVKPSEPVLRLGAKDGPWELELKIPQKHIGQVLRAYERLRKQEKPLVLDVDYVLLGSTTKLYKGRLHFERIAGEATPDTEQQSGEAEPAVLAYVRIEGDDIADGYRAYGRRGGVRRSGRAEEHKDDER